ncbi:MAG: flavodoxin domain-containing protein [Tistlia sp.]|uniref:flavodoxin domain-containing protein n=1 Tax=Tistlia sp. TaxID=3057121 RepID=UPI0034A26125
MGQQSISLLVLVATMTGTAEILAEDLEREFSDTVDFRIQLLEELEVGALERESLALVVSSTYGTGDVPETAEPTLQALKDARPDLGSLSYGIISLGDGTYVNTFARGGDNWDEALAACGATRRGEVLKVDCLLVEDPLEAAKEWFGRWLAAVADPQAEGSAAHRAGGSPG